MITVRWADGASVHTEHELGALPALLARKELFLWLDLESPNPQELDILRDPCKFHDLAIEDAVHTVQRPKIDEFDNWFFLVAHEVGAKEPADDDERVATTQISMFVREGLLVTVHEGPSGTINEVRERCEHRNPTLRRGADFLLYTLLDALVDRYFPILDSLDDEIDALEDRIVQEPRRELLDSIFSLKRTLIGLRRIAGPTREVLTMLTTRDFPVIHEDSVPYFRDVSDHLIRIYEILDSYRDLMSGALDAYLSNISNQLNLVMQRLTIVTVIFLPLTFITGIFGMNFKVQPWMPEWDHGQIFWAVMGIMAVFGVILAWWFHRKRLL